MNMQKHVPKPVIDPQQIKSMRYQTPYFLLSEKELQNSIQTFRNSFHNADVYYAMKANSEIEVLRFIKNQGLGFEVASYYELNLLKKVGVLPEKVIYGTAVKPVKHIKKFVKFGVDRFAFDSEQELEKLSKYAPGSRVYTRMLVDDSADSVFTMSKKFGIKPSRGIKLLLRAKELGLRPYGLSFNVGSQARNPKAWERGVEDLLSILNELKQYDVNLKMIDIGGGFPQSYIDNDGFASIETIAKYTNKALQKLPKGIEIIVEPGRGIVASSMLLIVSVVAKIRRANGYWLYLDGGAYNALLESMSYQGTTHYRVSTLKSYKNPDTEKFILTGPTGDNLDVINRSEVLPASIKVGDKLVIHDTGAYSTVLSTKFNGFPKPRVHVV